MTATDTDDYSVAACFPKVKVIIALFALAFDWSSHAAVVPPDGFFPKPETLHYYFLGTLSDGRQIQLSLNRNDAVTGSVFSLKRSLLQKVKGTASGHRFSLKTPRDDIRIRWSREAGFFGEWQESRNGKIHNLSLTQVAHSKTFRMDQDKRHTMYAVYPVFTHGAPRENLEALNRKIADHFQNLIRTIDQKWGAKGLSELFSHTERVSIRFFSVDLISLQVFVEYFGWIRPQYLLFGMNYQVNNGEVRKLKLSDLFTPNSGWEKEVPLLVGRALPEVLRRQAKEGYYIPELGLCPDVIDDLTIDSLEQFSVSPAGIEFHLPTIYSPPSSGSYNLTLPYGVLKPYLKKNGPLKRWIP